MRGHRDDNHSFFPTTSARGSKVLSVVEDVLGVVRGSRIQVVDTPTRQRYDFETNVLPESQTLQITLKSPGVENAGLIANIDSRDMTLPKRPKNREWKRRDHQYAYRNIRNKRDDIGGVAPTTLRNRSLYGHLIAHFRFLLGSRFHQGSLYNKAYR